MKGAQKLKKLFVCHSHQRGSSRDMATILEYTNVTGPNQSESSCNRPPQTHNRTPEIVDTIWV